MRENLQPLQGRRCEFSAIFVRLGTKPATRFGPAKTTVLLREVCGTDGKELTDHIWMIMGKQLAACDLTPGDRIKFSAIVKAYWKGYYDEREADYKLAWPLRFRRVLPSQTGLEPTAWPADWKNQMDKAMQQLHLFPNE